MKISYKELLTQADELIPKEIAQKEFKELADYLNIVIDTSSLDSAINNLFENIQGSVFSTNAAAGGLTRAITNRIPLDKPIPEAMTRRVTVVRLWCLCIRLIYRKFKEEKNKQGEQLFGKKIKELNNIAFVYEYQDEALKIIADLASELEI